MEFPFNGDETKLFGWLTVKYGEPTAQKFLDLKWTANQLLGASEASLKETAVINSVGARLFGELNTIKSQSQGATHMRSRQDIEKILFEELAIAPQKATVDKMVEYYSVQLPYVTSAGLVGLYDKAGRIPNTSTRATTKAIYGGLVLDGIFPGSGGRAELLRAFRGTQPLLVKIPREEDEAAAELLAFEQLGAYDPSLTCILGPVRKIELLREGRVVELAIEMPICTCSVDTVPRPADMAMVNRTALTLVTALNFIHSKNRVHGDVKLSNIMMREAGDQYLADLGSSVEVGANLATTLNSLPLHVINVNDLTATFELDWFQAGLSLVHLLNWKTGADRVGKEDVVRLLRSIDNPSESIETILKKLA